MDDASDGDNHSSVSIGSDPSGTPSPLETDSEEISEEPLIGAEQYTYKELIFQALSESYYKRDGRGINYDEICKYIKDRHVLPGDFHRHYQSELRTLIVENQIEQTDYGFMICPGRLPIRKDSEAPQEAQEVQSMSREGSVTSVSSPDPLTLLSLGITAAEEKPKAEATASEAESEATAESRVVSDDHWDLEVEKAAKVYETSLQLLKENEIILDLATDLLAKCANGEEVYVW